VRNFIVFIKKAKIMNKKMFYFLLVTFFMVFSGNTFTYDRGSEDFLNALLQGNLENVKVCLEKEGKDVTFGYFRDEETGISLEHGTSPIHIACFKGHLYIVKYLFENGFAGVCDTDVRFLYMPIHYACMGGNLDVLNYLISLKADVNCKMEHFGLTPLAIACKYNRISIVKRLLEAGADMHLRDIYKNTAILIASRAGNIEIIMYLLKMGANLSDENMHKMSTILFFNGRLSSLILDRVSKEDQARFSKFLNKIIEFDESKDKITFVLSEILLADFTEVKNNLFLFMSRFFYFPNLPAILSGADLGGIADQEDFCAKLYAEFVIDLYKKINNNKRAREILAQSFGFKSFGFKENVSEKYFHNLAKQEFQDGVLLYNKKNKMKKYISDHEFRSNLYKNTKKDVLIRCLN
jgi:FOG: Ankyrin repeat